MQDIITLNPNEELQISWIRGDIKFQSTIIPQVITKFQNGYLVDVGVIGITPYFNSIEVGFFESIKIQTRLIVSQN